MTEINQPEFKGVYSPGVLEFVRIANEFCAFVEATAEKTGAGFIAESLGKLSALYAAAVKMERTEPVLETGNEKFVTEQDWATVFQGVRYLLGSHNSYLRIADNEEFDRSDLVTHTISEDIADVYQDVKDFTLQYRQGVEEIMNDALYEVMESFDQYWSSKLLHALSALNTLFVKKIDPESEEDEPGNAPDPKYNNSFFTRLQDRNMDDDDV